MGRFPSQKDGEECRIFVDIYVFFFYVCKVVFYYSIFMPARRPFVTYTISRSTVYVSLFPFSSWQATSVVLVVKTNYIL